ncbi:MAG: NAD-dependent epimerase/dehydratase family protein [Acidobacteria bacterium]|nr:NAD-dependent epimerase/dehydratase family protein [Acidobacteriota bacterium]
MNVLVTGGTGFVGSHLVRGLLERGATVRCLARRRSRFDNLKDLPIEIVYGDLRAAESLRVAMKDCQTVYHCAADYRLYAKDPQELYAANVDGTRNLMQAAWDEGVERVVYTSTVGALGLHRDGTPADEKTPVTIDDMIGHYKRSKFLAEREVENWIARGLPVVIVNPSTPVGELDLKPTPTGKIIVDFLRGKMFGFVETGMNLIDVKDCAEGHILAAERGTIGEKYILGHRNLTLKEIFDALSNLTGIKSPTFSVPQWVAESYARMENFWSIRLRQREPFAPLESVRMARHKMWFDSSKAVRELGLPQNPIEDALQRAIVWFQAHGYVD